MFKRFAFLVVGALLLASLGVGAAAAQSGISGSSAAPGEIEFTGLVQTLPEGSLTGTWTVQGLKVEVGADTEQEGDFAVGSAVKVEGSLQENGTVLAREIKVDDEAAEEARADEMDFEGSIQSLPEGGLIGTWKVGSLNVVVTADTELKGDFKVGDKVKVEGALQEDGSILAKEVKEDRSGPRLHEDRGRRGQVDADDGDGDNSHRGRGRGRGRGD